MFAVGRVAQWLAHQSYTLLVGGSNPSSPTNPPCRPLKQPLNETNGPRGSVRFGANADPVKKVVSLTGIRSE